jgi:hypothetical protein
MKAEIDWKALISAPELSGLPAMPANEPPLTHVQEIGTCLYEYG